jgi:hypothetical protein
MGKEIGEGGKSVGLEAKRESPHKMRAIIQRLNSI